MKHVTLKELAITWKELAQWISEMPEEAQDEPVKICKDTVDGNQTMLGMDFMQTDSIHGAYIEYETDYEYMDHLEEDGQEGT